MTNWRLLNPLGRKSDRPYSVREGEEEEVSEGQLLVKLDDAETNAQLLGAIARLKTSQQIELPRNWV